MADAYVKRPDDVIPVEFDLRAFVTEAVAAGVAIEDVTFSLRATAGLSITTSMGTPGLITLTVGGGVMGRVYDFGIEASAPDGDSKVDMRKLRVRDPSLFNLLPPDDEVLVGGSGVVTESGDFLVTEGGDFLVWE